MNPKQILFTDVSSQTWIEEIILNAESHPGFSESSSWSIQKKQLHGGLSEGVDLIEVNNGALTLSILPSRGMGVWKGAFQGIPLEWKSPVKTPINPAFVNLSERGGLGWLSGFNELICRCGLISNGPPGTDSAGNPLESELTLHGRIANTPAHYVCVELNPAEGGMIKITGRMEEGILFGSHFLLESTLETQIGSSEFLIRDRITNLGPDAAESELLYHINIGPPFLEAGSKFMMPFDEMAPRDPRAAEGVKDFNTYLGPTPDYAEQAYYFLPICDEKGETPALLCNKQGDLGFQVSFKKAFLPYFTLWKNTGSESGGYVTGLEPAINFPNFRGVEREQGRLRALGSGDSYETEFRISILNHQDSVDEVRQKITKLNEQSPSIIHDQPHDRFS
ncbi:MAG: aldose 1-epimerase family protein [Planctomycetes bacterium]|nr:aldose 1-epimerase family protein [Planctomycetota bacterium]MCH9723279.1 aldose 1-epimerase family protein [Planctomycetota bacterium]MCH9777968.1 aldose 1-epimerase family protein [Planctomycetota bacterium]MCH9791433.1 aldose 1-epimerase family protein [Planctomycetota bacterium]